jgi:hypothetical protein
MIAMKVLLKTKDAGEAHNFATDLGYGYATIRVTMAAAETDPRQQWYGLSDDDNVAEFEHAVRFARETGEWQIAQTAPKYGMPTQEAAATWEAWLERQPAADLRDALADPETHPDTAAFIRGWLGAAEEQ